MGLDLEDVLAPYVSEPTPLDKPELFLIYGRAGSGKSHMSATTLEIPGFKKGLYIDTEGSSVGVVKDPRWDVLRVDKYPNQERLKALEEKRGSDNLDIEEERFRFLNTLLSDGPQGIFNPRNKHEYDVIVVDTFDVAQDWAQKYFLEGAGRVFSRGGEVDGFAGWSNVKQWSNNLAYHMKRMDPLGVLVVHDREEKSKSGAMVKTLRLSGASKDTLPGIPDVVMYLERLVEEGEYVSYAYFGTSDGKVTKDRFNFPPVVKNVTIPKLFSFIEKKETK